MAPLRRACLARRGHPPRLKQHGSARQRISVIAAVLLEAGRESELAWQSLPNGYFTQHTVADFLEGLLWRDPRPLILIWDGAPCHHGESIRKLQQRYPQLLLAPLPPYAPDLNLVEYLWNYLKLGPLVNWAPEALTQLHAALETHLGAVAEDPQRLQSLYNAAHRCWKEAMQNLDT